MDLCLPVTTIISDNIFWTWSHKYIEVGAREQRRSRRSWEMTVVTRVVLFTVGVPRNSPICITAAKARAFVGGPGRRE